MNEVSTGSLGLNPDEFERVMEAVKSLLETHHVDDFVYEVRNREMKGWDGPLAKSFAADCAILRAAIKEYFL